MQETIGFSDWLPSFLNILLLDEVIVMRRLAEFVMRHLAGLELARIIPLLHTR